jgi:hypothetical protein
MVSGDFAEGTMFCSHCGKKAEGNFCWACGARLQLGPSTPEPPSHLAVVEPDAQGLPELLPIKDAVPTAAEAWHDEIRYRVLLHFPQVRDVLAHYAALARPGVSGEQFIELCDKAFEPMVGVSFKTIAAIAMPLNERLGIKTGKSRTEVIPRPAGLTLVAGLASLARYGRELKRVTQLDDGCTVVAAIPSDLRTMTGGEMSFTVLRQPQAALVEASTHIPGQLYDWGKSTETLRQLFDDLGTLQFDPLTTIGSPDGQVSGLVEKAA